MLPVPVPFWLYQVDGNGNVVPLATAVPTFVAYVDKLGNARTPQPLITNLGGGQYVFTPSDGDQRAGTIAVIDGGAVAVPQIQSAAINQGDNAFFAYVVFDLNGQLGSGAPTVGAYVDFTGAARTPPAMVPVGVLAYLYTLTPSAADLTVGVTFRIDGAAGTQPPSSNGYFAGTGVLSTAAKNPAADLASLIANLSPYSAATLILDGSTGANLFTGPVRAVRTEVPSLSVFCMNHRGQPPEPFLGIGQDFKEFLIEVTVRSDPAQFQAGEQLARDIMQRIQRQQPSGYITCLVQQAGPDYLGEDGERTHQWSFGVELWWKG